MGLTDILWKYVLVCMEYDWNASNGCLSVEWVKDKQ